MGRRSDSDDDYDLKKSKKKKKRRSRSRSRSSGSDSSRYSSKHKKSKKSKHKKRSRSRSRERITRRSRSRSRGRRSRSRERYRSRSRSRDRHRYDRSRSRDRYARRRSRSDSRSRRRSRSDSRSRTRRSRSRSRGRRSRTPDRKKNKSRKRSPSPKDIQGDIREEIPGFDDMTPAEQANARMKLALKAAAAADEKIREQLGGGPAPTSEEMTNFSNAVLNIESDKFKQSAFKSSRGDVIKTEPKNDGYTTHEQAIFGAGRVEIKLEPVKPVYIEPDSYAHPNLYADPEEKMERWIQKLSAMRKRKLEGEAL